MSASRVLRAACLGLLLWLPADAALTDDGLTRAVESFVHEACHPRPPRLDVDGLPPRQARLLRQLACGRYACRQEAERAIRSTKPWPSNLVEAGCGSRDAEVRHRCMRMKEEREAVICTHCRGTRRCILEREMGYCPLCRYVLGLPKVADQCRLCEGTGEVRVP